MQTFAWLASSEVCSSSRNFKSFAELEEAVALYFNLQQTKLEKMRANYDAYFKKVEIQFGLKAINEIAENLMKFDNNEKMYLCFELREMDDGTLVQDSITDGEPSFNINFDQMTTDQLQLFWETTDKYLRIK